MDNRLGNRLTQLRGSRSLREVGRGSSVSHTYLRDLEIGKDCNPSPEILKKIADYYNTSYEELLILAGYIDEVSRGGENALIVEDQRFFITKYEAKVLKLTLEQIRGLMKLIKQNIND